MSASGTRATPQTRMLDTSPRRKERTPGTGSPNATPNHVGDQPAKRFPIVAEMEVNESATAATVGRCSRGAWSMTKGMSGTKRKVVAKPCKSAQARIAPGLVMRASSVDATI